MSLVSLGTTPKLLLARQRVSSAIPVPTTVELALELSMHPFGVWCGACVARRHIQEIRLVGRDALGLPHPSDGLVGKVDGEVVARVGGGRNEIPRSDRIGFQWFMSPALKP